MLQKGFILQISFLFAFCIFWKNREDQIFLELSMDLGQRFHCFFFILNSIPWICSTRKYRKFIFSIQLQIWNFLPKNEILKIPIDQCLPKAKLDSDIVWKMPPNNAISDYRCSVLALPYRCGGYVCTRAHIIFIHFIYTQKASYICQSIHKWDLLAAKFGQKSPSCCSIAIFNFLISIAERLFRIAFLLIHSKVAFDCCSMSMNGEVVVNKRNGWLPLGRQFLLYGKISNK